MTRSNVYLAGTRKRLGFAYERDGRNIHWHAPMVYPIQESDEESDEQSAEKSDATDTAMSDTSAVIASRPVKRPLITVGLPVLPLASPPRHAATPTVTSSAAYTPAATAADTDPSVAAAPPTEPTTQHDSRSDPSTQPNAKRYELIMLHVGSTAAPPTRSVMSS